MTLHEIQIKKILYPTDLSENAKYAFDYAISLASRYGARLTLMHVLPEVPRSLDTSVIGYLSSEQWEEIKARHFQEAQQALIGKRKDHHAVKEVLDQFCAGVIGDSSTSVETEEVVVTYGNPVNEILKTAEEKGCDLIVMGTHGQGGLADALLGSTARRVVRRANVPVLTVRLPVEAD